MRETLFNARGRDQTRVRRAFGWVITFRDFPAGSWQTVDGDSMMTEALTLFTKGRAELWLDGARRADRVPGVLSSEHAVVGQGGEFKLVYVEPTTRLCIPAGINHGRLPQVRKRWADGATTVEAGAQLLVCLGALRHGALTTPAERTVVITADTVLEADPGTLLLEFER